MAKFIITPGKALGAAPWSIKATYIVIIMLSITNLADAFFEGKLVGLYLGMTGIWAIVLAAVVSYLVYDLGNTLARKRRIAMDIGYGISAGFIGVGLWKVFADGVYSSLIVIALATLLAVFLSIPQTKEFFVKK